MLFNLIPKTSKHYYRFILGLLFVSVGFVIAIMSMFVSGYYQLDAINKKFDVEAATSLSYKKEFIYAQTKNFENYLMIVDKTSEFENFIQTNPKNATHAKEDVTSIMTAITNLYPNIMQFRFIDKDGFEAIRIDRDSAGETPYKVDENLLQDKSQRYYFKEAKRMSKEKIWFSNLDLNIEHEKIVEPIVPTLRIAKPCYFNGEFRGILLINLFMQDILNETMKSELFNVAIIDKDLNILNSNLPGYEKGKNEWTKYLEKAKDIKYLENQNENGFFLKLLFQKKHFNIELSDIIQNSEGLKLVFETKPEKLLEYTHDIRDYMLVMLLIVFIISLPITIRLSRYPLKLHDKLEKFKDNLENKLEIIDKYVCMSRTDLDGNIIDVSTAFSELTGYSKDELIGVSHRILKHPDTPSIVYEKMWSSLIDGKRWTGVIKNIRKDGNKYWTKNNITPVIENDKIVGFTAIIENITDQKIIEEISIKDELTGTYNRRFFNQTFPQELKRAKRKGDVFCIAMFDIDYFKNYNDTYGHIKGDEVLQQVVTKICDKLQRAGDYLFRIGGEEFIVIYTEMKSLEEAEKFSLELVQAVEALGIEHKTSGIADVLTMSLGLLYITPECNMDENTILNSIDKLLYLAKNGGRNKFVSKKC